MGGKVFSQKNCCGTEAIQKTILNSRGQQRGRMILGLIDLHSKIKVYSKYSTQLEI